LLNARVFNTHHGVTEHLTTHHGGRRGVLLRSVFVVGYLVLGLASGLEAFSREPPCDSIGALAVRQTPETSDWVHFVSILTTLPLARSPAEPTHGTSMLSSRVDPPVLELQQGTGRGCGATQGPTSVKRLARCAGGCNSRARRVAARAGSPSPHPLSQAA
jgi:hypothetical protein